METAQEHVKRRRKYVQACEIFFGPANRSTRHQVVASRLACNHEDGDFNVEFGASLHMMSKNEVTSGEKDTIRQRKVRVDGRSDSLRQRFGRLSSR